MKKELDELEQKIKEVSVWLAKEYSRINTGIATPSFLDGINVESYGAMSPLKNVASINIEDAKTLRIAPWDKSLGKVIEKAIQVSNLGVSTVLDDAGLRVIFPALTTEKRQDYVKIAKKILEEARISIRKIREDYINILKKMELSQDEEKATKESIQKLVDSGNSLLEEVFARKEFEILN